MKRSQSLENLSADWFLGVIALEKPKNVTSLVSLWEHLRKKQLGKWSEKRGFDSKSLNEALDNLLSEGDAVFCDSEKEKKDKLDEKLNKMDSQLLYGIVRAVHVKTHLSVLDEQVTQEEMPREQIISGLLKDQLKTSLILQTFLKFLTKFDENVSEDEILQKFEEFLNSAVLRLVSTVHPNETERNINLMHYNELLGKYEMWKKDFESLKLLEVSAPEYRIRRERLNNLRREMKAEIEGAWQSDFMRRGPITVQSEARRILKRYDVIFHTLPLFVKFVKHLAKEAYFLWMSSRFAKKDPKFLDTFARQYKETNQSRQDRILAIKKTFEALNIDITPKIPKVKESIITFSTWKGGDRDGNPFVVASFSNQTFVEQKQYILNYYLQLVQDLIDKITPADAQVNISKNLMDSLVEDRSIFPYVDNVKPQEPYRAKLRYIIEKLSNTWTRCNEVVKKAGETVRPLLSQSLPGPIGYNTADELKKDINVLYNSLLKNSGKSQGRSVLQNLKILVETFGFHLCSIDFRQTSDKNTAAISEYLKAIGHEKAKSFKTLKEAEKRQLLLDLITDKNLSLNPWLINSTLSKISKDTFDTLLIYSDAGKTDRRAVGKFIISMCTSVSDILIVMLLLKLTGMLSISDNGDIVCHEDITGLFETIDDLKAAPIIVRDLLSIPIIRKYICNHRKGKFTVMLGYSDSVRDGSSLASDANVSNASIELKKIQDEVNQNDPLLPVQLVLYRGRGDTIPRGFGGYITRAIASQSYTSLQEDHTEQNRYLRRYASTSSALDHLHSIYSAHLTAVTRPIQKETDRYLRYFEFFGNISSWKWSQLVREKYGDIYFDILQKYSILPILSTCCFASRPVCREGVSYNIENIRAIPFTMALAQLREFTNAYYGTGTAFDMGSKILEDMEGTTAFLFEQFVLLNNSKDEIVNMITSSGQGNTTNVAPIITLVKAVFPKLIEKYNTDLQGMIQQMKPSVQSDHVEIISDLMKRYNSETTAINEVSLLMLDLKDRNLKSIDILREMYLNYGPFQYSMENKETALLIRQKDIVDEYCKEATKQEKDVLQLTEEEAQLTKNWILSINGRKKLMSHGQKLNFDTPELYILHKIQSKFLREHAKLRASPTSTERDHMLSTMSFYAQMTILAISEALGFGG